MDHHHHDGHHSADWFRAGAHGRSGWRQSLAVLAVVLLTAAIAAALAAPAADASVIAQTAAPHRCGQVTFDFPAGNGGASASAIVARGLRCRQARRAVWVCLHGRRPDGWSVRFRTKDVVMSSGGRRITYRPAGGGGCL